MTFDTSKYLLKKNLLERVRSENVKTPLGDMFAQALLKYQQNQEKREELETQSAIASATGASGTAAEVSGIYNNDELKNRLATLDTRFQERHDNKTLSARASAIYTSTRDMLNNQMRVNADWDNRMGQFSTFEESIDSLID